MQTKYWCRGCAAYGESPCVYAGHISEEMRLLGAHWKSHKTPKLVIATPPASGRGSIEWVPCDAEGKPKR